MSMSDIFTDPSGSVSKHLQHPNHLAMP